MTDYEVRLKGCDDSTRVILDLSVQDVATLLHVATIINPASVDQCQPSMRLRRVGEAEWSPEEDDE